VSKETGQQEVDRDVGVHDGAGDACEEAGEADPCAARQVEPRERLLHRPGRDVDDPPEPALDHAVDDELHEPDRGGHVRPHPREEGLLVDLAEVAGRGTAVVVDQDVDRGHGRDQALRPVGRAEVDGDRDHGGARLLPDLLGRAFELPAVAAVDHHGAARAGQFGGTSAAEPLTGRAHHGRAPDEPKIHGRSMARGPNVIGVTVSMVFRLVRG
jgi:hypothetical protein